MKAKSIRKLKAAPIKRTLTPSVGTSERLHAIANKLLAGRPNPHPFARIEEL